MFKRLPCWARCDNIRIKMDISRRTVWDLSLIHIWFVWQDQQITSCMYDGGMFGATETSYPTPFYLEGRTVYVAEDLVDAIFSSDTAPGA